MIRSAIVVYLMAWLALGPVLPALAQGEYTIGVGDVLEVTVWQRQELGGEFEVDTEGNISLPLIGSIRALGQTPSDLAEELTRRFSFVERDVSQVTVSVSNYHSRRIFVMGEVLRPGAYAFPQIPGIWDIIREAGGPSPEAALTRVRVIPPEGAGSPQVVDLERVLSTGDFSSLPPLDPGSTILVPRLETLGPEGDVIHVYGFVNDPGTFPIDSARTVLQAVLAAGGPTDNGNVKAVRVVRPGPVRARVFKVNLNEYTHDGVLFANVPLLPGDTVTVPRNEAVTVWRIIDQGSRIILNVFAAIFFIRALQGDDNSGGGTTSQATSELP